MLELEFPTLGHLCFYEISCMWHFLLFRQPLLLEYSTSADSRNITFLLKPSNQQIALFSQPTDCHFFTTYRLPISYNQQNAIFSQPIDRAFFFQPTERYFFTTYRSRIFLSTNRSLFFYNRHIVLFSQPTHRYFFTTDTSHFLQPIDRAFFFQPIELFVRSIEHV
jgi:hypothetical protein